MDSNVTRPKVSVCIPTYNAAGFIAATLQSILGSTFKHEIEIIVSDDASQDATCSIVEGLADPRIRLYRNAETVGPVRNWNNAITRGTGDYLGLLNHDDLYGPFWLTFAIHTLEKHPHVGWVTSAYRVIDAEGKDLETTVIFPETREYALTETFDEVVKLNGLGPGFIARRKILDEIGFYDEGAGPQADNDLFLRLACRFPMFYCTFPHNAWRLHAHNLTHRWNVVDQANEGLYILHKTFNDPALPVEFQYSRKEVLGHFFMKVVVLARKFKENGDADTALELMGIAYRNGYDGESPFVSLPSRRNKLEGNNR